MCGIAGIVGKSPRGCIERMVATMAHRGPDDSGIFADERITLGHARLSILDLSPRGHQPMCNADETVWIVYNGEMYNFRQQRELLEQKGHFFHSNSDTEVLLHLYEVYGDDFLLRLRGMFALAIYDKRRGQGRERLLLARDHLGIKPLLYTEVEGRLVFASEVKALLASGLVARRIDPEALRLLLTFGSVIQPRTMIAGVKMLPTAHRLIFEAGQVRIERFWQLSDNRRPEVKDLPYAEQVSLVREALEDSVRLQMVGDVPVGAFLSGGVDSSLLVALMARETSQKIRTFSVGFGSEGAAIDETDDAARVARFVGTDHTRVEVTGGQVAASILQIAAGLDQPSVDGVNSYFVSRAARQGVTVALSGTGGDESFGGYPWFIAMVLAARRAERHPLFWGGLHGAGKLLQHPALDRLAPTRLGKWLEHARGLGGFLPQYARTYHIFGASGSSRMLAPALRDEVQAGREMALDLAMADELATALPLERVSALCMRGYLQNQLLRDIDAVSMAQSLEVRVPYLDVELIDLALALPLSSKLSELSGVPRAVTASYRETGTKKILVDIGRDLLPPGMDAQKKRGFAMPFGAWLQGPLREIFEDALSPARVADRGLLDVRAVARLKDDFDRGAVDWSGPWLCMMTELWCRQVLDGAA